MAQVTSDNPLPRFITKALVKVSHATVNRDRASPVWTHVKERDDLVMVLDHVRALVASQQYVDRRILRVVCGSEVIVSEVTAKTESSTAIFVEQWGLDFLSW